MANTATLFCGWRPVKPSRPGDRIFESTSIDPEHHALAENGWVFVTNIVANSVPAFLAAANNSKLDEFCLHANAYSAFGLGLEGYWSVWGRLSRESKLLALTALAERPN